MRKIFCDCCGKEMSYDDGPTKSILSENVVALKKGPKLKIKIEVKSNEVGNGNHIDICGLCRWEAVSKINPLALAPAEFNPGNF